MKDEHFYPLSKFMLTGTIGVDYGVVHEPGHDCDREDHHLGHDITVIVLNVEELGNPSNKITLAIPTRSHFFEALMDGSLVASIHRQRVRFEEE